MLRTLALIGAIVAPLSALTLSQPAHADVDFDIHFGVPFYVDRPGPGYRYYDGYGWYDYRKYRDFRPRGRLSCGEARELVRDRGYRRVRTIECRGRTYTFRAIRRGEPYRVYVNSRNGRIWRG
jgi:hypothetical protein